ncbi:MAG TPA: hypothetical protein VM164_07335 [Burkholderiales bacterium]|nr:hypothetical protein [Burkholderiales bacterium]
MNARPIVFAACVLALAFFGGCGEKPTVTVYKQGQYQGKPDNVPWQSQPFNNDKASWETAIKARNNGQNEYLRVGTQ